MNRAFALPGRRDIVASLGVFTVAIPLSLEIALASGVPPEYRNRHRHHRWFDRRCPKRRRPDLVLAIHTPYGILDFDGPKDMAFPKAFLPWVSLGHFPGSLGRYMWHDRSVPVLTIELKIKGEESLKSLSDLDNLQDVSGSLALQVKPRSASGGH